jgi:peptide/nickel transport system permease protein
MGAYTIRRLLWVPVTVVLVSIIVFLTVRFIPGNIVDIMESQIAQFANGTAPPRLALEHALGLDVPFYVQYARWIGNIVIHGSLGTSLVSSSDITPRVLAALPVTFELSILSLIIGLVISIPIGVYAALRQDTITDYIGRSIAIVLISVPSFWIGVMIMIYPSIWWHWSPPVELIPFIKDPLRNLGMFIIPSIVLGAALAGTTMRMTRAMMLEVLRQDYIRTAWAKGLTERVIVIRHALKNSLIPVITIVGMQIPFLISGAVIIERIFVLPGIGTLILGALSQRDYPIVEGVSLVVSTFVIFVNLFVDLTYGLLDPRIHYQ